MAVYAPLSEICFPSLLPPLTERPSTEIIGCDSQPSICCNSNTDLLILNNANVCFLSMEDTHPPDTHLDIVTGVQDSRLRRLYEYWAAKKGNRRFPARADIDPLDFSYVLGRVMLLDVLRDPLRFRYRVHGTDMVMRAGYDLTGKFLDDLPITEYRKYVQERCEGLVRDREPLLVHYNRTLDGRTRHYEALWLPFSEDGENVSMLLCALIYDWQP